MERNHRQELADISGKSSQIKPKGDWAVTVSYKVGMSGPIVYSVELSNPVTGFEWQGTVDASSQVTD